MTTPSNGLQALLDKEAIRDCLYRYCRGIDRLDETALRSAYWPDGTDNHGAYKGTAAGFVDWALQKLPGAGRMVHNIGNILIELRGSVAAVESSFLAFQQDLDAQGQPVQTRAVYFARGTQVFQAAVYGPKLPDEPLDAFFAGLRLAAP